MAGLPARLQFFNRLAGYSALVYLASIGGLSLYRGTAEPPDWWIIVTTLLGCAMGALTRDVPDELSEFDELSDLEAHQKRENGDR